MNDEFHDIYMYCYERKYFSIPYQQDEKRRKKNSHTEHNFYSHTKMPSLYHRRNIDQKISRAGRKK